MKRELSLLALLVVCVPLVGCGGSGDGGNNPNPAGEAFAALRGNTLLRGDVNNLDRATSQTITGLPGGTSLIAMDRRPSDGSLVAFGTDDRIYVINPTTAVATVVGAAAIFPATTGARFGFDFNPVVDRIRVIGDDGQNFRLNPDTGAVAGSDTSISDVNAEIVAAAYANNSVGTLTTTLFAIDANAGTLVMDGGVDGIPSPNGGVITTIGSLGINIPGDASFDISSTGTAYLQTESNLYTVNLTTGQATSLGMFTGGPVNAFVITH